MSRTAATVIVASSALLREGMVSLLQGTPYKVMAAVARPAELADHHFAKGRRVLAIVGVDWQSGSLDQAAESVRLLRSLMPDGKIILVAETNGPVDLQGVLALAPDGYILNLGSRDMLVKSLELMFMDQQIFVLGRSITALPNGQGGIQSPERAETSDSRDRCQFVTDDNRVRLSHREHQVLICLARLNRTKPLHDYVISRKRPLRSTSKPFCARPMRATAPKLQFGRSNTVCGTPRLSTTTLSRNIKTRRRNRMTRRRPMVPILSPVESTDMRLTQKPLKHSMRS